MWLNYIETQRIANPWTSVRNFGADQTEEYISGLYYSFDLLTDNPRMGRAYDARRRRYVYRSHHVYDRALKDTILIVDIRHTRQSLAE